ncbi:MAG: fluoride efflux transporter CrcB [Proteobacteria bacterium]|nr:fluoride efflux transporter CrcB [Pseudomonadota bacterium]
MSPTHLLVIGIGGFLGAVSRYVISNSMSVWFGPSFPLGTLTVNAVGSFLLGFLSRYFLEHLVVSELVRISLLIGFLGAFTTFSTFSYESIVLLQEGDFFKAGANILSNGIVCLLLCFIGLQLAKSM